MSGFAPGHLPAFNKDGRFSPPGPHQSALFQFLFPLTFGETDGKDRNIFAYAPYKYERFSKIFKNCLYVS